MSTTRHRLITARLANVAGAPAPRTRPARTGLARVGKALSREAPRLFARRGFAETDLATHWREIAGPALADVTEPERLSGKTLTVRVMGPAALEVQHQSTQILERLSRLLGPGKVARLKLVHGLVAPPAGARNPAGARTSRPAGTSEPDAEVMARAARLGDRTLADRLTRVAAALAAKREDGVSTQDDR